MSTTVIPDTEPTADFNQRCLAVLNQWEAGSLPYRDATSQLETLAQEAQDSQHLANQGRVEQLLGYMEHYRGHLDPAIRHFQRARLLFQQVGNRLRVARMDLNLGESYRYKGDFTRARLNYRSALEAGRQLGDIRMQTISLINEGQLQLAMNQFDNARQSLEESYELVQVLTAQNVDTRSMLCELHAGRAALALQHGEVDAAWEEAMSAQKIGTEVPSQWSTGLTHRVVGEVLTARIMRGDDLPESPENDPEEHFRMATEAFQDIKAEAEIARTLYTQGRSLAKRGKQMTAGRKLQQAVLAFTKLGMNDDAAKAAQAQIESLSNRG